MNNNNQVITENINHSDIELMAQGHFDIVPLLSEDWDSPEDDVWDSV